MNRVLFPENPTFSARRLRELLASRNLTNRWLAGETGYNEATVSRFVQGHLPISRKFAVRAADALDIPLSWLLEVSEVAA